ncbi:MAG: endo-1,4-beta-xylanase [Phycisphaerae bacterium]
MRILPVALMVSALVLASADFAAALVIQVKDARIKTTGAAVEGGWHLYSNGEVGEYVRAEQFGTHELVVRACGTPCKGVWPIMQARVDGTGGPTVSVNSKDFADYTLRVEIPAGVNRVTVAFTNDALEGDEDRNLYLERIEVRPAPGGEAVTLAGREEWVAVGEQREEQALEQAAQGIERFRKGPATVRVVGADGQCVADAAVTAELTRHDFLFGCNIYMFDRIKLPEQNAVYKERFAELFNYATTYFYWRAYEPERGKPKYEYTDKVVAWAQERGIRLKGHPLLWGTESGIPAWSQGQPPPDAQKARVREIMKRYAGKIEFWEVVNEPAHVASPKIDEPYRWARAADPKAVLIVNDYYVFGDGCPPFLKLLTDAKAAGVPFDGIGIQAHEPLTMRFPLDQVQRILDQYAALGLPIHITEFTPTSAGQPITGSRRSGVWDETAQAEYAERFYRVIFGHPATVALTWWDMCDQGSWQKGGGLLREDLSPKPAYDSLRRLIHGEWKTHAEGRTDGAGTFALRGFYGRYRVQVRFGGRTVVGEFHLAKTGPNDWVVKLPA